jgi:hypothetical protein
MGVLRLINEPIYTTRYTVAVCYPGTNLNGLVKLKLLNKTLKVQLAKIFTIT